MRTINEERVIQGFPIPQIGFYKVYVQSNTYNQAQYIEDCLNGVSIQKTNFPFVHHVIDDFSTDGEQNVIKDWMNKKCNMDDAEYYDNDICTIILAKYKNNSNNTIVVYFLKRNLYKEPNKKEKLYAQWQSVCPYEAICEGDDYWTDADKLQKQVDFLDAHPQYSAIAGNAKKIREDGTNIGLFSTTSSSRDLTDMGEIVRCRQFHTASILYDREAYQKAPMFDSANGWDTWKWCCLMSQGPIRYENEVNCVYRCGTGVTSSTSRLKWILLQEKWENLLFTTFSPKYINFNDAYYPLLTDVFGVMTNKDTNEEDKEQLRTIFKKYITLSLLMEMVPMMFKHYASRLKRTLTKR